MKKIKLLLLAVPFIALTSCDPQEEDPKPEPEVQEMNFEFNHTCNDVDISFSDGPYTLPDGSVVIPARLSYILSGFYLIDQNDQRIDFDDQYALVNASTGGTEFKLTKVPKGTYKAVGFALGLDSATNHGDPNQYPIDHPLSPVNNNLHWSWVGGYIFLGIEGRLDGTNENYIFHLAGSNNLVNYELPINFTKGNKALNAHMTLKYEEIFQNPEIFSLENDGMSTHSTTGPVTAKLVGNLIDIFELEEIHE